MSNDQKKYNKIWVKPSISILKIRDTMGKPTPFVSEEHANVGVAGGGKFIDDGPS